MFGGGFHNETADAQRGDLILQFVNEQGDGGVMTSGWVHNRLLEWGPLPLGTDPYPFTRLASVSSDNGSPTYVYHQLSLDVLAEGEYSIAAGWVTKNISTSS